MSLKPSSLKADQTLAKRRSAIRYGQLRRFVKSGLWAYSKRYDAYFNVSTRKWMEGRCSDDECRYCAKRPKLAPKPRPE